MTPKAPKNDRQPSAAAQKPRPEQDPATTAGSDVQGEGNYDATRRYDRAASDFAKQPERVERAAQAAQPRDEQEAADLRRAEEEGKSHSKGER